VVATGLRWQKRFRVFTPGIVPLPAGITGASCLGLEGETPSLQPRVGGAGSATGGMDRRGGKFDGMNRIVRKMAGSHALDVVAETRRGDLGNMKP
jgi:hypothetical protein